MRRAARVNQTTANTLLRAAVRAQKKPHKYHAKAMIVDGIRFASKAEAKRYGELKLLQMAGEIHALSVQPRFLLCPFSLWGEATSIGEYRGDFTYCRCRRGEKCQLTQRVVEDVKGLDTPLSKWKRKHAEAQYGIQIQVIR